MIRSSLSDQLYDYDRNERQISALNSFHQGNKRIQENNNNNQEYNSTKKTITVRQHRQFTHAGAFQAPSGNTANAASATATTQPIGWSSRSGAIRLVRLDAPSQIVEGQPIKLRCLHENRGDKLQSLSWSRNGREFYRYQPFERNPQLQHLYFNSSGIQPDVSFNCNNVMSINYAKS